MLEGWPVVTDPKVHVAKINELFDSGVTIINVHAGQMDQQQVIEFYGKPTRSAAGPTGSVAGPS